MKKLPISKKTQEEIHNHIEKVGNFFTEKDVRKLIEIEQYNLLNRVYCYISDKYFVKDMDLKYIPTTKIIESLCKDLEDNYDMHKRFDGKL